MTANKLANMQPTLVEHDELKLIGIPCIGLTEMGQKYQLAKESLLLTVNETISPGNQYQRSLRNMA